MQIIAAIIFLLVLTFPIITRLWFDYLLSGDGWRQGDWLINFGAGLIRRGLLGEFWISLSDLSGLPLIGLLIATQGMLLMLFMALLLTIWFKDENRFLSVLLIASPLFCIMVWAGDLQGIMRKEILGYIALACLALYSLGQSRSLTLPIASSVFFALGCIGNVIHILLVPVMLSGIYILYTHERLSRRSALSFSVLLALIAFLALVLAQLFKEISELAPICDPLVARGLKPEFCDHAIRWLVSGEVSHAGEVALRVRPDTVSHFFAVIGLSLIALFVIFRVFADGRQLFLLLLLSFVPLLPLYVIATDWGRWATISYTAFAFLVIIFNSTGNMPVRYRPPPIVLVALFFIPLVITPAHTIGWRLGGVLKTTFETAIVFR